MGLLQSTEQKTKVILLFGLDNIYNNFIIDEFYEICKEEYCYDDNDIINFDSLRELNCIVHPMYYNGNKFVFIICNILKNPAYCKRSDYIKMLVDNFKNMNININKVMFILVDYCDRRLFNEQLETFYLLNNCINFKAKINVIIIKHICSNCDGNYNCRFNISSMINDTYILREYPLIYLQHSWDDKIIDESRETLKKILYN